MSYIGRIITSGIDAGTPMRKLLRKHSVTDRYDFPKEKAKKQNVIIYN